MDARHACSRLGFRRDRLGTALAALLACGLPVELGSETLTLSSTYPSPAGVYARIVTTGGSPASPQHTVLNRDAGNVGIGLTNPGAALEVGGSIGIANAGKIRWRDTSGSLVDVLSWSGDTLFIRNPASNPIVLTAQQLVFHTMDNAERLRVTSFGDVGIGTSSPGAKLEVAGQVKITGGGPGPGKVLTSSADGTASWQSPVQGGTLLCVNRSGAGSDLTGDQQCAPQNETCAAVVGGIGSGSCDDTARDGLIRCCRIGP